MLKIRQTLRKRDIFHMLISVGMVFVITGLLYPFQKELELAIVVLVYLLPIGISAARWGMASGTLSAIAAFVLINYFFTEAYFTLKVNKVEDIVALVAFLALTITISRLVGRMKDSLALAQAREDETARLYELSMSLSRLPKETDILDSLARHTLDSFHAAQVEVVTEGESNALLARLPDPHPEENSTPSKIISMQGTHRLVGEIRLWRLDPFNPAEEQLLATFAAQGVLALERARLTSAEARARILEESDRMKAALLSSVSHELRTPLSTIKAAVSSLNSQAVEWESEARHDLLNAIEEETDHLNQLVGNLLNMSRIEAGALKLQRRWSMLPEVISAAMRKARSASQSHQIKMQIPDELPLVYLDDVLMEQVFVNLIDNSRKYSPPGTPITIQAHHNAYHVIVRITNQGPRVSEENLPKIFEKFHRVTAADQITGTGLGLSICKGIVEAHQGHIRALNLPTGFAIEFDLPIRTGTTTPKLPVE